MKFTVSGQTQNRYYIVSSLNEKEAAEETHLQIFTEGLTAERLAHRTQKSIEAAAPACPLCGRPMIRRVAKKGINSGHEFWSCSGYPECNGTRDIR